MKLLGNITYGFFVALLLGVTGLFLATLMPIPGNIEVKIVKSGSMAPAIPVGSMVVVKPQARYQVGEVITFGADTKRSIPTTHRIVAVEGSGSSAVYTVKGDANEEADPSRVLHREVIGRVLVAVPYAGFVLDFARQPIGFALLIGLPAALIIIEELAVILRELRRYIRKKDPPQSTGPTGGGAGDERQEETCRVTYHRSRATDDVFVPIAIAPLGQRAKQRRSSTRGERRVGISLMSILMIAVLTLSDAAGATLSYFADIETSAGNRMQAGVWEVLSVQFFTLVLDEEPEAQVLGTSTESMQEEPPQEEEPTLEISEPVVVVEEDPPAAPEAPAAQTRDERQDRTTPGREPPGKETVAEETTEEEGGGEVEEETAEEEQENSTEVPTGPAEGEEPAAPPPDEEVETPTLEEVGEPTESVGLEEPAPASEPAPEPAPALAPELPPPPSPPSEAPGGQGEQAPAALPDPTPPPAPEPAPAAAG